MSLAIQTALATPPRNVARRPSDTDSRISPCFQRACMHSAIPDSGKGRTALRGDTLGRTPRTGVCRNSFGVVYIGTLPAPCADRTSSPVALRGQKSDFSNVPDGAKSFHRSQTGVKVNLQMVRIAANRSPARLAACWRGRAGRVTCCTPRRPVNGYFLLRLGMTQRLQAL
jgi:hypothetical protein